MESRKSASCVPPPRMGWVEELLLVLIFGTIFLTAVVLVSVQGALRAVKNRIFGKPLGEWQALAVTLLVGALVLALV